MKNVNQIVASNLDRLMSSREELNSQVKLAKRAKIGPTNVGRIRRAEISPTIETLEAIANVFDLTAADMLREDLLDSSGKVRALAKIPSPISNMPAVPSMARPIITRLSAEGFPDTVYRIIDGILDLASSDK